jgi:predicted nucleic acid-binding protein
MVGARKLVFDTSVYISAIRGGLASPAFLALQEGLPRTHLVSVVSAELRAGATSKAARDAVLQFTRLAERVGRVVTPSAAAWNGAGDVLARIREREPRLRSKAARLWNDLLIATSARQIGATVVTENAQDFELLRRYFKFELQVLTGFRPDDSNTV